MSVEVYDVMQCDVRHGQSIHNGTGIFHGGSPGEDVLLTDRGQCQGVAAGLLMKRLVEVAKFTPVTAIHHSSLPRARQTGRLVAEAYGFPTVVVLPGTEEVDHGQLQFAGLPDEMADIERAQTTGAFLAALSRFKTVDAETRAKHGGWVAPNGWGDGKSYADVAIETYTATDRFLGQNGAVFVGHNGAQRQSRALRGTIRLNDRRELAALHAALPFQEARAANKEVVIAFRERNGRGPNPLELETLLMPLAEASVPLILELGRLSVPAIDGVVQNKTKLGNGTIATYGVLADGRIVRDQLFAPIVLDENVGLTPDSFTITPGSDWI